MTVIIIFDMLLQPFKGTSKKYLNQSSTDKKNTPRIIKYKNKFSKRKLGLDDSYLERDITVLLANYLQLQFIIDGFANFPVFIYEVYHYYPSDMSQYDDD